MATDNVVPINEEHVSKVMGIPSIGVNMVVLKRIAPTNQTYNLSVLKQNLENFPICEEFLKSFLIFSYATMLAPNSMLEGIHDLWDTI